MTSPRLRAFTATVALAGATGAGTLAIAPRANAAPTTAVHLLATPSTKAIGDLMPASMPADALQAVSRVRRNCGITTCSWYFSRATTRTIKRNFDIYGWSAKTAASRLCRLVPHVGAKVACVIAVGYHY